MRTSRLVQADADHVTSRAATSQRHGDHRPEYSRALLRGRSSFRQFLCRPPTAPQPKGEGSDRCRPAWCQRSDSAASRTAASEFPDWRKSPSRLQRRCSEREQRYSSLIRPQEMDIIGEREAAEGDQAEGVEQEVGEAPPHLTTLASPGSTPPMLLCGSQQKPLSVERIGAAKRLQVSKRHPDLTLLSQQPPQLRPHGARPLLLRCRRACRLAAALASRWRSRLNTRKISMPILSIAVLQSS